MTRNLKTLGLALVAAFAFSVVAASAASAVNHHFNGTAGKALTVVASGKQVFEATTGEGKGYTCESVAVNGSVGAATSTSVTVKPEYDNPNDCHAFEGAEKTVNTNVIENGCHYTFTGVTTTSNPTGGEHATVDIGCEAGKAIEIRATGLNLKCSRIGTQEVTDAVRYDDLGNGQIKVTATAHGITSSTEGICGEGTHTNGSYTGEVTVTAEGGVSLSQT